MNKVSEFPVKTKKVKAQDLGLKYYFVHRNGEFLIQQRKDDFIWKKLFEFPPEISEELMPFIKSAKIVNHKLTHKNLSIEIFNVEVDSEIVWKDFIAKNDFIVINVEGSHEKSFPKPLENYIENYHTAYRIL
jgi:A/G-specific adenine glycosylase